MLGVTSQEGGGRKSGRPRQALSFAALSLALLSACGGLTGRDQAEKGSGDGDSPGDGDGDSPGDGDGDLPGDGDGDFPGDGDGDFDVIPKPEFDLDGIPLYSRVVPLTNLQWARSVQTVLNLPEPAAHADRFLDPVHGVTLFDNNERVLVVNNQMRQDYQYAAAELAQEQLSEANALARINAGSDADTFIRNLGRRAYRRPLTEEEVAAYQILYGVGAELPGDESEFEKSANLVIEAMLQSPHFLYRSELSPDGGPLTSFEVLSKLSFWILRTSPDDDLLDRAAEGEFDTPAGVLALAEEMLTDPRASEMIIDLYSQLYWLHRLENILKEDPMWTPELNRELEQVSRLFFEHVYENDQGLDAILTSTEGFVGPLLAPFYGIAPAPDAPTLHDLGPERPGYFSQVPYQMMMGDGSHSDAIHRGILLTLRVLCAKLVLPDGVAVPPLSPPDPNRTDRERVEALTGVGTCGEGCHAYIDPLGFAFENFDGLGRERTTDNGKPVDTFAAYPFGDGENPMVTFDGAPELMPLIASTQEAHACMAKSLISYALARDITIDDESLMLQLAEVSRSEGGSIKQVLREIVTSPAFHSRPGAM